MDLKKRDTLGEAFLNGVVDRHEHGLLRVEQLYRRTKFHRLAWRAGWRVADVLTARPLRTAAARAKPRLHIREAS